jgi:hypothetical protein
MWLFNLYRKVFKPRKFTFDGREYVQADAGQGVVASALLSHPAAAILADECAAVLTKSGAENFVMFDMMSEHGPLRVTVQWAKGESPAEQNDRLKSEIMRLRAQLEQM